MRKVLLLVFLAVGVLAVALFSNDQELGDKSPEIVSGEEQGKLENYSVDFGGVKYGVNLFVVESGDKIFLYPNFSEKKNATSLSVESGCKALVSGGFYTEDNQPLGLFISEGQRLRGFGQNSLHNGILSVNQFGTFRITRSEPSGDLRWAVQSGPFLAENGQYLQLSLVRDKEARRVAGAVTGGNELIFVVVYDPASLYKGPFLADMPEILKKIDGEQNLGIADALNLDGGSASAFVHGDYKLTELSPIGSYFCVK